MDLLKHLEALEAFGGRTGEKQVTAIGATGDTISAQPGGRSPASAKAAAFLERLGALPREAEPVRKAMDLYHNQNFAPPAVAFRTIDQRKLEDSLCQLRSFDALTDLLEEGATIGAISVAADRVHVIAPGNGSSGDPLSSGGRFDITAQVERAAVALKARESASFLQKTAEPVGQNRVEGARPDGELPQVVRLRRQEGRGQPVLRDIPPESTSSLRGRLREFFRHHPAIASMDELGPTTTFLIAGLPIRTADGQFVPLEVVREEARTVLLERLQQRDPGRQAPIAYARVEEIEDMPLPQQFFEPSAGGEGAGPDGLPSAARIELAYRLVKGLSLTPEEGEPLEQSVRTRLERMLGASFSHVRLHTGPAAKWITESLQARALTYGHNVFIPREMVASNDPRDQRTLVHELVHVQQNVDGDLRDRGQREAEAERAEMSLDATNFTLPRSIRPEGEFMPVPRQDFSAPDGVFMAREGDEPAARSTAGRTKKVELREEPVLDKIEKELAEDRSREKEDLRDRVY